MNFPRHDCGFSLPLTSLSGEELEKFFAQLNPPLPSYRIKQINQWIWRGAFSFEQMSDLPLSLREEFKNRFSLYGSSVQQSLADSDGTIKLRIGLQDGAAVEAVLLHDGSDRFTACLSSQAGCPVGCVFCKTGALGFSRNLEAYEITEQFLHLFAKTEKKITNIVIMGMGEPLLNLNALRESLNLVGAGAGLSPRRITVSTSGIVQGIREMADRGPKAELAFSLTTAREDLRRRLMPGCIHSLSEIKEALLYYQKKNGRRITLETVLLGGINTEDHEALIDFARGLFSVVNVIPWNPVGGLSFEGKALHEPSLSEIDGFIRMLEKGGLTVTRRYRKGRGISGACGQLGIIGTKAEPEQYR